MNLLCISGSLRQASFNTMLLREAVALLDGVDATFADLRLPLYDGDIEAQGIPAPVQALIDQIAAADAIAIASPEYNKGISAALKNAIDWQSRVKPVPLVGKPVAIMSAAAGRAGGEVGQFQLRHALAPFHVRLAAGPAVLIAGAHTAFEDGRLKDEMARKLLGELMASLKALV